MNFVEKSGLVSKGIARGPEREEEFIIIVFTYITV